MATPPLVISDLQEWRAAGVAGDSTGGLVGPSGTEPATDLVREAQQLLQGITPGEWRVDHKGVLGEGRQWNPNGVRRVAHCAKTTSYAQPDLDRENTANATFIAAAPRLVRQLLAALAALQEAPSLAIQQRYERALREIATGTTAWTRDQMIDCATEAITHFSRDTESP